jgi:hypothetical protein
MEDDVLEVKQTVARKYPGRSWEDLSVDERRAVLADTSVTADFADALMSDQLPEMVQAGRIVAANPWNAAANAVSKVTAGAMVGQARRENELGRKAAADLLTRRDAVDAEERRREEEEERRQRNALYQMFGRGV